MHSSIWKKRWLIAVLVLFMMLVTLAGCGKNNQMSGTPAEGQMIVKVLDVGQGDAILIRSGNQVTLVDTGDISARDRLVEHLKKEKIATIDTVVITHPHADHLGGMAAVFEHFSVKRIFDSGLQTSTATYRKYLETVDKKKVPFSIVTAGQTVDIGGGAVLKILAPEKPFLLEDNGSLDLNNNSIVTKLTFGSFSMLLTGDAEKASEARMLKNYGADLKSSILKIGHHGSNTSTTVEFLKAVAPEAAIISLGANNDYHHPHPSTMKKLEGKMKIYRTDLNGTVTVTTDGKSYTVSKEKDK